MDPIRKVMSLVDENKDSLPEGIYLEICDNLKRIYAIGDSAREIYLLNLTNDYLKLFEDNEALRHEIVEQKRELLRARVSRFENVTRPVLRPNSVLESIMYDPNSPVLNIMR